MQKFSVSFSLGNGAEIHGGDTDHYFNVYLAEKIKKNQHDPCIVFIMKNIKDTYHQLFDEALEKYNSTKKPCRKIKDYYEHISSGNRESPFYEAIVQFGDSINAPVGSERGKIAKQLLTEYMKGFQERNPNLHVFYAVLHMDGASPRLRIDFVPFYSKNHKNGLVKGVSMRAALEEMGYISKGYRENHLSLWEQAERKVMNQLLKVHGYTREDKHVKHKHMSVYEYKEMLRRDAMMKNARAKIFQEGDLQAIKELQIKLASAEQQVEQQEAERKERWKKHGTV